jgi:hypothetical protein
MIVDMLLNTPSHAESLVTRPCSRIGTVITSLEIQYKEDTRARYYVTLARDLRITTHRTSPPAR